MNYQILMWLLAIGCLGILSLVYIGWTLNTEIYRMDARLDFAKSLLGNTRSYREYLMDTGQLQKWKEYNKHKFLARTDEVPWVDPIPNPELTAKITEALKKADDKIVEAEVIIVEAPLEPPMLPSPHRTEA